MELDELSIIANNFNLLLWNLMNYQSLQTISTYYYGIDCNQFQSITMELEKIEESSATFFTHKNHLHSSPIKEVEAKEQRQRPVHTNWAAIYLYLFH